LWTLFCVSNSTAIFRPITWIFFSLDCTLSIYYIPPPSDFVCCEWDKVLVCVAGSAQGLRPSSTQPKQNKT
jgi:hypothetical protein